MHYAFKNLAELPLVVTWLFDWSAIKMKALKILPFLVLGLFAFCNYSCTTSKKFNYMPTRIELNKPPINTINTASVGANLLLNGSYREFSGNLSRPEFNNNVEYDLSQSKIIGYKGAKIEVIEATNE